MFCNPRHYCKSIVVNTYLFNIYFPTRLQGLGLCLLSEPQWLICRNYLINICGKEEGKNGVKDWTRGRGERERPREEGYCSRSA